MTSYPEYMTPDLLGSSYLYTDSSVSNSVFSYVVSLSMAVDKDTMQQTVDSLMPRFPQFAVRPVREDDAVVYERISGRVTVRDLSEREGIVLGQDTLLSVSVFHKTVLFDFHRSLTDEKGVVPFIRSVIFHYLLRSGYDVENDGSVISEKSEFHLIEAGDAFIRLDDIPASRPVWYMDAKALEISGPEGPGPFRVTRIQIPLAKVRGIARDYFPTPSTVISPFFAQALLEEYPDRQVSGEYVISYIQVNLRQYFPTTTSRPFFVNLPLAYNRKISEYPAATVLMSQKKLLEAQLRTDALAYNAQRKINSIDRILETAGMDRKAEAFTRMFSDMSHVATFSSCNIGSVIMPETVLQYITEFYPIVGVSMFPFGMTMINFKGDLQITVSGPSHDDRTCRRFAALLRQHDIPAFISESYLHSALNYKPVL